MKVSLTYPVPEGHCQITIKHTKWWKKVQRNKTKLQAPESGSTPDWGPRLPPRWSLFLHYLSCKAGVGAPPGSRFLAYMSEKKNLERSPNPSYEFF